MLVVFSALVTTAKAGSKSTVGISFIKGTWEPLSHVYLNFGSMTIKEESVVWASGQKSSFRVIKENEEGVIIELTAKKIPKFHGTVYKFIRLSLKGSGNLEVSFYEAHKGINDPDAMWGCYVKPEK